MAQEAKKVKTRWELLVEAGPEEAGDLMCDMFDDCQECPMYNKCHPSTINGIRTAWIEWFREEVKEL